MKQKIVAFLTQENQAQSLEQILDGLKIDSRKANQVESALNDLVASFDLVLTKKKKYILASLAGYQHGILHVVNTNYGFVDGDDHTYVKRENFNTAINLDEVIVVRKEGSDGRFEGQIVSVVERHTEFILGTLSQSKGQWLMTPYGQKVTLPIHFGNSKNLPLKAGNRYVMRILSVDRVITVDLDSLLGHQQDIGIDVLSVLFEYDIEPAFSDEVLKQAEASPKQIDDQEYQQRVDLREHLIFTIDGEDAKDLDDAISLEYGDGLYRLGVHIADVSFYVPENSALDLEAYKRSTSTYVVDRVVPMLPFQLSNGLCSLNPGEDRLCLSCEMDYDDHGNLLDYRIFPSVIHSKARLTYTQVNQVFNDEETSLDSVISEKLLQMRGLAEILRSRKESLGMLDFETSESKFILDQAGHVLDIHRIEHGEAEEMIEDFMVSANETVAAYSKYRSLPILYRVHEKPTKEKMQTFSHLARTLGYRMKGNMDEVRPKQVQKVLTHFRYENTYPIISKILLRSMSKARYDTQCLGHFGLALENYTHFTSPIRRYPDLIVHRTLRKYLFNENFTELESDEALREEQAKHTSYREKMSTEAERDVEKIKKMEYMQNKIGNVYSGVISGVIRFGFFVELENTVEGLVHVKSLDSYFEFDELKLSLISQDKKTQYHLGQRVKIKVRGVNTTEETIEFVLAEKEKRRGSHHGKSGRRQSKSKA